MEAIFLFLHILGALLVGAFVLLAFFSIFRNASNQYKRFLYMLSGGLIAQAITGSGLELTMSHPATFLVFCSKILLYLGVVLGTQVILVIQMQKKQMEIPYYLLVRSTAVTMFCLLFTGLLIG